LCRRRRQWRRGLKKEGKAEKLKVAKVKAEKPGGKLLWLFSAVLDGKLEGYMHEEIDKNRLDGGALPRTAQTC